jgi:hypothetical protein
MPVDGAPPLLIIAGAAGAQLSRTGSPPTKRATRRNCCRPPLGHTARARGRLSHSNHTWRSVPNDAAGNGGVDVVPGDIHPHWLLISRQLGRRAGTDLDPVAIRKVNRRIEDYPVAPLDAAVDFNLLSEIAYHCDLAQVHHVVLHHGDL